MKKTIVLDIKTGFSDVLADSFNLLKYIDFILIGYDESSALTGSKLFEEISTAFISKGAVSCIIRCGAKGAYIKDSSTAVGYLLPAYKNIRVVDKTGAGDAFCSGFVYGLSKNMSVRQSALLGNAVGAMCIMEAGATSNIKSYSEIKKFMERTST